jgi:FlaA1/EpsC-like NDP-sugar epimerase
VIDAALRRPFIRWLAQHREPLQAAIDTAAWSCGLLFASLVRLDFNPDRLDWRGFAVMVPMAAGAQLMGGLTFGLYLHRWRFGSFEEVAGLARAVASATMILLFVDLLFRVRPVPISAVLGGGLTALTFMAATRYAWRLGLEARRRPTEGDAQPMIVFGAGEGGAQVITAMMRNPNSPYLPVALLDDNPRKRKLRIMGVPVVGGRHDLAVVVKDYSAKILLVAIPSATATVIAELEDLGVAAGLEVKVLPPVNELFGSRVGVNDIRDVTEEDLLGRHVIETDVASIASYLTNKKVLVTGAGGSIGSELCRQIWRFAPAELVMVDRDESALHAVQLSIEGRALLDTRSTVLCDIRDRADVRRLFADYRPEVVFHAAALKHLPLLERFPSEAAKTNVLGTLYILQAAVEAGVKRFVNISTDKAADPVSVLGYSKRVAERLTAEIARSAPGIYLSVRFGNVLGSRGSVLETFHAQLDCGGPLTVTDPDVTRYFMTIPEAVQLVIQAGAIGRQGEALVLDMGDPVRINELAERLVAHADRPTKIVYTGLRPGEKMHEVLLGRDEIDHRPVHPLISHVDVTPLAVGDLTQLCESLDLDRERVIERMRALCADRTSAFDS